VIKFEEVTKIYPPSTVGLEKVSLHIEKGEFVFLVGPSGSGKSTFIRLLIKELEPDRGRVSVGGRDLAALRRWKIPYLRRNIGCVFQDFKLLPNKTAFENVMYALLVTGSANADSKKKAMEILNLVGLGHKAESFPTQMSGGEQQRVSIARAFVNHPPLLIADETSMGIMQLLYRINKTGTTVLMATHDREMVDRMRRRVIALEEGKVVRDQKRGGYGED
jgi:cell division transport system ATP-binding protein